MFLRGVGADKRRRGLGWVGGLSWVGGGVVWLVTRVWRWSGQAWQCGAKMAQAAAPYAGGWLLAAARAGGPRFRLRRWPAFR